MMRVVRWFGPVVALLFVVLAGPESVLAQEVGDRVARGSLRPYWHVFAAYAIAWVLVFGWIVSIARRLGKLERDIAVSRD
ncbi:MAG: CcmD family protein [Gemmatimonadota bacterium]